MYEIFPKRLFGSAIGIGGVDFGSKGKVLVRKDDLVLVWFYDYRTTPFGVRGFGQEYCPARLDLTSSPP